jgi:DNA-binding HxlR family transcriptional regulator
LKAATLHMLSSGSMCFGRLKKNIPHVSHKILTQQLRELERDGIVRRSVYAEAPP